MIIREKQAKSILSKSRIYDYALNPYTGCQHACTYCYARFMQRYSGHQEAWGEFVDVKVNAPDLLMTEVNKKKAGRVWISGVCDPYQPLEGKYRLTRRCLEILVRKQWPVTVQTRSPLVVRDIDILQEAKELEVGFSITTVDEKMRKLFEPAAPSIDQRIKALENLHMAGIRTFAMIAPVLPGGEYLPGLLHGKVDYIRVDRLNYSYANWVYKKYHLEEKQSDSFFRETIRKIALICQKLEMDCRSPT
jgi:DNA repair photolyase